MLFNVLAIASSSAFFYVFLQQTEGSTSWQDVFKIAIMLSIAALGSPVTQWVKNGLSALLKKPIEDRLALVLTGAIACGVATLELWLSHALDFSTITVDTFPQAFFMVMTASTVYYGWLKGSESFFGRKALLKEL